MKTLQEQYNLIEEGKGQKEVFLKQAKRLFPNLIPNHFGYQESALILKQRGIISEVTKAGGLVTTPAINPFEQFNKFVNEEYTTYKWDYEVQENPVKPQTPMGAKDVKSVNKNVSAEVEATQKVGHDYKNDKDIDNVYGEEFLKGYYAEMKDPKNAEKDVEQLKEIVRKNLAKNPSYYVENAAFGVKGIGYTKEAPGLGEPKEAKGKYKASGYGDLNESIKNIAKSINETGTN
jgi:hypothetical protein